MGRTLRLFAGAAAMLVVAVGVAAFLKDEPGYESGRSEISGKIVGLTEFQENREERAAADVADRGQAALPSSSAGSAGDSAGGTPRESDRSVSASAPFDTRPASVETEKSSEVPAAATGDSARPAENKASPSAPVRAEKEKSASSSANEKASSTKAEAEKQDRRAATTPDSVQGRAETSEKKTVTPEEGGQAGETSAEKEQAGQTYERVVTSAKFSMQGSQIKLTLQGNAPMVGHYFTLGDPDRVVLDLAGNWEITVPRVPSNRLIQAVRVGQHDDKTRLVFDMKTTGKAALVPLNRNALELRIQ